MKTLFLILFPLVSFAQDEWVRYSDLPVKVKSQVDSIYFKNALRIIEPDTFYLVESRIKNWSMDLVFKNGEIIDRSEYRHHSIFGYVGFASVVLLLLTVIFNSHLT